MSFYQKTLAVLLAILMAVSLSGCGEKAGTVSSTTRLEASATCIGCHENVRSPVTGKLIAEEWKLSSHNRNNWAGCADCHEPHAGHPSSCNLCHGGTPSGRSAVHNPDESGKCAKCHTANAGYGFSIHNGVTINTLQAHFTNITSGVIPRAYPGLFYSVMSTAVIKNAAGGTANWVSSRYKPVSGDITKYGCRACHNPHDTTSQISIHRQWSRSGHGDPASAARTSSDFKSRGSTDSAKTTVGGYCVRCHTSTGFINYVKSDFINIAALAPANDPDHSKEVTGCNVCHDDGRGNAYGYSLRDVLQAAPGRSGVPAYYNYSAAIGGNTNAIPSTTVRNVQITYPNASNSNMCVVCHMGREIGLVIKKAAVSGLDFTKTARINSHIFAAGANLFQESGFEFYTSAATKYPDTSIRHTKAGMNNIQGTGSRGPCIACHMNSSMSHTFMPITKDLSGAVTSITSLTCAKCHPSAVTNNKNMDKDILEFNRQGFKAAMKFLRDLLVSSGISTGPPLPNGTISYKTNWTVVCGNDNIVPGSGNLAGGADSIPSSAYTMGAAFNYELLFADYGAYVHNPNYIKRLIFDSIDWLQDCSLTATNGADVCSSIADPVAKAYLCGITNVRP